MSKKRILYIRKGHCEKMDNLEWRLEDVLKESGLKKCLSWSNPSGRKQPYNCGFESDEEGGFLVLYEKTAIHNFDNPYMQIVSDVVLLPFGATEALVQRTYKTVKEKMAMVEGGSCREKIKE